jgi:branched-chain amino acid transport system ATP-binding protein
MTQGLRLENVTVKRGGLTLCHNVDLAVPPGEITVLLGPNGAGKTTLLDCIAGKLSSATGAIRLDGERIDELPMHRRSARGLSYIEQGRNFFSKLTVAQNIAVVDRSPQALAHAFALFPQLEKKSNLKASLLSGGEQQMLMIAVALATRPRYLLIDELSLGLSASAIAALTKVLTSLAKSGMGILVVEQFVDIALRIGSTAHIMHHGKIVQSGSCSAMLNDRNSIIHPGFQ